MEHPVFKEFDPANDCDCPGCVLHRRVTPYSPTGRATGHPAVRRTAVVAAASATALGAGHAAPALADSPQATGTHPSLAVGTNLPPAAETVLPTDDEPRTPQGSPAPLHGLGGRLVQPAAAAEPRPTTRAEIIRRARIWVAAKVPYNMDAYWSDGYRQDCSGYVSMAWDLPGSEWTGSLDQHAERISQEELQPGDILLFHNPSDPGGGSHVVIFGGWSDDSHTNYIAYEQTRPHTRRQSTPYAYWSNSDRYLAYRYRGITEDAPGDEPETAKTESPDAGPFPGQAHFGPGANNEYVTQLGELLVERGAGRFYRSGPGPRWTDADRRATRAFQRAQGWRGAQADGLPGSHTWQLLVTGGGNGIEAETDASSSRGTPAFPGRAMFRPGADNQHVTRLGRQLVKKGFGKHYTNGPGSRWTEVDRRNVEAFQRAQGWRGGAANGYPGPETWRRLFT